MDLDDLKQSLFTVMGKLLHESRKYLDEQFKHFDLTRNEWVILALLRVNPEGLSQNYAKSYLGIENSYFTKILKKLESKKYIIRTICFKDKRNKIISIHPDSVKQVKNIFKIIIDHNKEIHMDLNVKQLKTIYDGLNCIAKRLEIDQDHH